MTIQLTQRHNASPVFLNPAQIAEVHDGSPRPGADAYTIVRLASGVPIEVQESATKVNELLGGPAVTIVWVRFEDVQAGDVVSANNQPWFRVVEKLDARGKVWLFDSTTVADQFADAISQGRNPTNSAQGRPLDLVRKQVLA